MFHLLEMLLNSKCGFWPAISANESRSFELDKSKAIFISGKSGIRSFDL